MIYAGYRPYPFTTKEMYEQKGLSPSLSNDISEHKDMLFYPHIIDGVDELGNKIFTIFHAYIDIDDSRYSITIFDVHEYIAENIEGKCIEEAVTYFEELLTKMSKD